MCERAVDAHLGTLKFVPDHYTTREMCERAVDAHPWILKFVPVKYKTQEMYNELMRTRPDLSTVAYQANMKNP